MNDVGGTLSVEGNGCTVEPQSDSPETSQLLTVGIPDQTATPLHFNMRNMSVRSFGSLDAADAYRGGSLELRSLSGGRIEDVSFLDNRGENGGSVYLDNCQNITFSSCLFTGSKALEQGGSIYLASLNKDVTLTSCVFENSSALSDGGAIYIYTQNDNMRITSSSFIHISAGRDGAVYFNSESDNVEISLSSFEDTLALQNGGAIFMNSSNNGAAISECGFSKISAFNCGGALYLSVDNDYMNIRSCVFTQQHLLVRMEVQYM